jgi:hypothetical protein
VNKERVRRLYRLEGLQLRMRVRRRKQIALHRGRRQYRPGRPNGGVWTSCMTPLPMAGRFAF